MISKPTVVQKAAMELYAAVEDYVQLFAEQPPCPFGGGSDEKCADVLAEAVRDGRPLPVDFAWWIDLPARLPS